MDEFVTIGQYGLAPLLTVFLGLFYRLVGDKLEDRFKAVIAVGVGIGLGILGLAYKGLPWSVVNVVDYALYGFMVGASAVGIYEVTRAKINPR